MRGHLESLCEPYAVLDLKHSFQRNVSSTAWVMDFEEKKAFENIANSVFVP